MSIVVPARSYAELMRILPDADDPIDITVTPNKSQVLFHVEGIDLVSRLIEGQFPNYEPVIPTDHSSRAVIDRESFLAGARRASIFARDSANIVKVEVGGEDGEGVSITAHAADVGDNADTLEATVEGQATTIAFNARYLIDVLANLRRRGGGARALRSAGARRDAGRRQGRLRPRHHAGPHGLLTPSDRCWRHAPDPPQPDRLPRLPRGGAAPRSRADDRGRAQWRRQDQPAGGGPRRHHRPFPPHGRRPRAGAPRAALRPGAAGPGRG